MPFLHHDNVKDRQKTKRTPNLVKVCRGSRLRYQCSKFQAHPTHYAQKRRERHTQFCWSHRGPGFSRVFPYEEKRWFGFLTHTTNLKESEHKTKVIVHKKHSPRFPMGKYPSLRHFNLQKRDFADFYKINHDHRLRSLKPGRFALQNKWNLNEPNRHSFLCQVTS